MKLPLTPLLYLVSLASLGGIVNSVIAFSNRPVTWDAKTRNQIKAENNKLMSQAASKDGGDQRWNYAAEGFWSQFKDANFTGVVQKVDAPVVDTPTTPVEKPREIIDLTTVFEVLCITSAGPQSRVVIKYISDVQVPEGMAVKPPVVTNTVPAGRRDMATTARPRPVSAGVEAPLHHLQVGDRLWPKYEYIVLKSVDEEAAFATFELQIEDKKDPEKGYPTQPLMQRVLGLPANVQEKMIAMRVAARGAAPAGAAEATEAPEAPAPQDEWVDVDKTMTLPDGKVHVSRKDQQFLEENGQNIFNEDVHMSDYASGVGEQKIRGVQVRKISSRMQQFGVEEGDVLISLNGIPVAGMANAKKVGRRLYQQGVRTFRGEFLRRGRIITRTYNFKK